MYISTVLFGLLAHTQRPRRISCVAPLTRGPRFDADRHVLAYPGDANGQGVGQDNTMIESLQEVTALFEVAQNTVFKLVADV